MKEIRKIQRIGKDGSTYSVTLPKKIVEQLNLQVSDYVVFNIECDKIILTKMI